MTKYAELQNELRQHPRKWLVTGVAGFIGSNLLENLLRLDQRVVGLDNFSTGHRRNLDEVQALVTPDQWARFQFIAGDIRTGADCGRACAGVDHVLHQAALGSVPRSITDPVATHASNVDGFIAMLVAARDAQVKSFVYASSSSVYGDEPTLPKVEERIGRPLSPYAATKRINEIYADVFTRCYQLGVTGLRYFNVFGPRQDPEGAYAAVIPRWFAAVLKDEPVCIYGDGETSRDFCYIDNVVQANLLAAAAPTAREARVYNIACGDRTTLKQLHAAISAVAAAKKPGLSGHAPKFESERAGDVRHSLAAIARAQHDLGYVPEYNLAAGLARSGDWYARP